MPETLSAALSVIKAAPDSNAAFPDFLKALRETHAKTEERIAVLFNNVLLLMVILELLNRAAVSEMSIGGLKIVDLSLIRKFAPVALAYYTYSFMSYMALRRVLLEALEISIRTLYGSVDSNRWAFIAAPSTLNTSFLLSVFSPRRWSAMENYMAFVISILMLLGPIAYLVYAYVSLLNKFGVGDILLWISAVSTVFLVVLGLIYVYTTVKIVGQGNEASQGTNPVRVDGVAG